MELLLYQVDAFSGSVFGGNPAAVCPLTDWPDDRTLLSIAAENNLSETAFFVRKKEYFELRWFTPTTEVDLCGHATLASAFVILSEIEPDRNEVTFETQSGTLIVTREGGLLAMDFPSRKPERCEAPENLVKALQTDPNEVFCSRDFLVVYENEEIIKSIRPDMELLKKLDLLGVIVTAPGKDVDFVSRFFAPKVGVPEDPVTGSAHCTLIPYWANRLKKKKLHALQLSSRCGELFCEDMNDRVKIAGSAALYLKGTIFI